MFEPDASGACGGRWIIDDEIALEGDESGLVVFGGVEVQDHDFGVVSLGEGFVEPSIPEGQAGHVSGGFSAVAGAFETAERFDGEILAEGLGVPLIQSPNRGCPRGGEEVE